MSRYFEVGIILVIFTIMAVMYVRLLESSSDSLGQILEQTDESDGPKSSESDETQMDISYSTYWAYFVCVIGMRKAYFFMSEFEL